MAMDMTTNTNTSSSKKKPCGKGRRKVEIKKIEDASSRMVAFSKRKKGLFNKASELHRLCDANIAVVIQSPSGRLFSFGKPSADSVIDKFLRDAGDNHQNKGETGDVEESTETLQLEEEEEEVKYWWEESIKDLSFEELKKYMVSLEALRNNVAIKLDEKIMRRASERDFLSFIY